MGGDRFPTACFPLPEARVKAAGLTVLPISVSRLRAPTHWPVTLFNAGSQLFTVVTDAVFSCM